MSEEQQEDLNSFPTKGWSCAKVREAVKHNVLENPGISAEEISRKERCPLFAVRRAIIFLANRGVIKPRV